MSFGKKTTVFCKTPSLFGDIQDSMAKKATPKSNTATDFKQQTKQKGKGGNFATAIGMTAVKL